MTIPNPDYFGSQNTYIAAQAARLMIAHGDSIVVPIQGNTVDLRTLQDNQSVAKGGDNYYFLITRRI